MSWLSSATGIHISAPAPLKKLGDVLGGMAANAIPGGSLFGAITGIGGTGGGGSNLQDVASQTGANLQQQAMAGLGAAQQTSQQQAAFSQLSGGFGALFASPAMLLLVVGAVVLLMRRK